MVEYQACMEYKACMWASHYTRMFPAPEVETVQLSLEGGTHAKNDKRRFMARARTTGLMRPGFDAEQD